MNRCLGPFGATCASHEVSRLSRIAALVLSTVMTRWKSVPCRRCGVRVNRRMNLRFWLLTSLWLVPMVVFAMQWSLAYVFGIALPLGMMIDNFVIPLNAEAD
jgi:hypothetical protein